MTGLDEDAQKELLKELKSLNSDITIIFTVHDFMLIDGLANRVITMASGRIIEERLIDREKQDYKAITATLNKAVLHDIPNLSMIHLTDSIVEIVVPANQSDQVLLLLLKNGSSIIELREKR